MSKIVNLKSGDKYGRLTVVERSGHVGKARAYIFDCDCGDTVKLSAHRVASGNTNSCGCLQKQKASEATRTHGKYGTRVYAIWAGMLTRAGKTDPYKNRPVCERWKVFENFYEDMGDPPEGLTLERLDNSKGYSPDNCAWRTYAEQARNRDYCIKLTKDGKTMTAAEWAKELNYPRTSFYRHLSQGKLDDMFDLG